MNVPIFAYLAIIFAVYLALAYFRGTTKPPLLSNAEFERLHKKYRGHPGNIDIFTIFAVVLETFVLFFGFAELREIYLSYLGISTSGIIYLSMPLGGIFVAALFMSIGSCGWLIDFIIHKFLGDDFWKYYYNLPHVGFDTRKIYRKVSIVFLLLSTAFLIIGIDDYSIVNPTGIKLNDWTRLQEANYSWDKILSIEEHHREESTFYVIKFIDGSQWNMANELWQNAEEKDVIGYISKNSGKQVAVK